MSLSYSYRARGCLVGKRQSSKQSGVGISLGLHPGALQLVALVGHTIEYRETLEHKEPPMRYHLELENLL